MKANVEIYTWSTCPYSQKAKALLQKKKVEYTEHCIDGDDLAREAMSKKAHGSKTLPQIFINNLHVGGCDDLHILEEICSLDEMLYFNYEVVAEIQNQPQQLAKVEIYTWNTCPYSKKAKVLLEARQIEYIEYCIDGDDAARKTMKTRANGRKTLPQIFINNLHIGGCDDLHILNDIGSLDEMLYSNHNSMEITKQKTQLLL